MRDPSWLIEKLKDPPPSLSELIVAEWLGTQVRTLRKLYPEACKSARETEEVKHDD